MIHRNRTCNPRRLLWLIATAVATAGVMLGQSDACTNILVSRGASVDGSVFVSFSVDGTGAGMLSVSPAGKKPAGENVHPSIADYDGPVYKVLNHIKYPLVKRPPTDVWNWPTKMKLPSPTIA